MHINEVNMKDIVGKDSGVIRDYYDDKRKLLPRERKSAIRKLIKTVANAEAIMFLARYQEEKLYTVGDIAEIFDFKHQFVEKNIMQHIEMNTLVLKADVRTALKSMLNEVIEKDEDVWFCSSDLAEEHMDIGVQEVTIGVEKAKECQNLLKSKKKNFVFEEDFISFVTKCFEVVIGEKRIEPPREAIQMTWKSVDTLKKNLKMRHNMQIYRLIRKPEYGFVKLEYLNYNTSKRPNVARYTKL